MITCTLLVGRATPPADRKFVLEMSKLKLKLPSLKLRGTIIIAAAAVFSVAIIASLFYVVSTNRAQDLAQADEVVGGLASTEAEKITSFLTKYAAAAESVAVTGTALLADGGVSINRT